MNDPSSLPDASRPPSVLADLNAEQQDRLAVVLDQFLSALESGAPLDANELAARHPDLREPLRLYLARLDELHHVSAGFANPAPSHDSARSHSVETGPGEEAVLPPSTRRLGDFVLGDEIGRGGMGVVYEARQISLDRRVALKVLPFASILDARTIARFKNEAKAAAPLQHPNIVPVYAVGSERGMHYYAMQLIEGRPLDQVITQVRARFRPETPDRKRRNRAEDATQEIAAPAVSTIAVSPVTDTATSASRGTALQRMASRELPRGEYYQTVLRLGIQAADALAAAHQEGIVHRDIKPSNLLVDHDGKLWVTDFGLARIQSDVALSRTGDVVGTWRYMSPEQARGDSPLIDQRTDVYSLGVTLWELLALRPAYQDDDRQALLRQLDQDSLPPLAPHCPDLPPDLETVVLKAMAHAREDRYTTADEFAADLRRVLEGKRPLARPPSWVDRLFRFARRHKRLVAATVIVAMFVAGLSTVAAIVTTRERLRAEKNFARAERHFREARRVVDRGAQLAERLAEIPGAESLRRELLQETLTYYQRFVRDAGDDPQLQADIALTFSKIGALASEFGSTDEALDANRQAVRRLQHLLDAQPRSVELRRATAVAQRQLADACREAGDLLSARLVCLDAVRNDRQLVTNYPENFEVRGDLAAALDSLGQIQAAAGEPDEARDHLVEAIQLARQVCDKFPAAAERRHQLATSLNQLGQWLGPRQPSEALLLHQQALKQLELADSTRGQSRSFRREVARSYDLLGTAQARLERWEAARDAYEQAIALRQPILEREPQLTTVRRELAATYNNLGLIQSRIGQPQLARDLFTQAIDAQSPLVTEDTADLALRSSLANMYNNRGFVEEQLSQDEAALVSYQQAVELQRKAYEQGRNVLRYRQLLSKHYFNQGRVLRRTKRFAEAVDAALSRKKLWQGDALRLQSVAEEIRLTANALAAADPSAMAKVAEYQKLSADILKEAQAVHASAESTNSDSPESGPAASNDFSLTPDSPN